MVPAAAFPTPFNSVCTLTLGATQTNPSCHSLPFTGNAHHSPFVSSSTRFPFNSSLKFQRFQHPHVNSGVAYGAGLRVDALKKKKKLGGPGGAGLAGIDDFDDGSDEDENEDEDEDEDEEAVVPFEEMREWYKNKPRGFGIGKVYDTSVEDKLLDEMQKSREAQATNLNKLKDSPIKPRANKIDQKKKEPEVVPNGIRVRMVNLPKKRNIHRDLKSALQGIPGIINIIPAVTGNKKTRDPVCKGFAFVDFKCEEDAAMFVQLYSGQIITFGKIQKQIKCELLNARSSSTASLELSKNLNSASHLMVPALVEDSNEDSEMDDSAMSSWDETTSDDSDNLVNKIHRQEQEDVIENKESATVLNVDSDESVETRIDSEISSFSLEQLNRNPTTEDKSPAELKQENVPKKKPTSKEKAKKVPKLFVPGSAKRLKIKEKALLSDVFSKYGSKAALASKDSQ